jgi:hypothetical protein
MLDTLRIEDTLIDYDDRAWAVHAAAVLEEISSLGDALFALWARSSRDDASWGGTLPTVYQWLRDLLSELADAIEVDGEDFAMSRAFGRMAAYSALFVDGLVQPAIANAMSDCADEGGRDCLRVVHGRLSLLQWTLECAARFRA